MNQAFLLACLFIGLINFEVSGLWAFNTNTQVIPLMTIVGFLIMHKKDLHLGVAWFLTLAFWRQDIVSLILALIAPIFLLRIFINRSVYALMGFGLVSYVSALLMVRLVSVVSESFGGKMIWLPEHLLVRMIFFILGLYLGALLLHFIQKNFTSQIAFKKSL